MTEKAMFGAGCFWGMEAAFLEVPGVVDVASGYSGGRTDNPTYRQVCSDTTGHAEVVEIDFDPEKVSYEELVEVFFRLHDPTTLNRQGPDFGSQYRSAIFYRTPEQREAAERVMAEQEASGRHGRPIVTEVTAAGQFFRAEEYHQRYFQRRGIAHH